MARGYCVDCHFEGRLGPMNECPRCGSDWTAEEDSALHDEDQLDGLFGARSGGHSERAEPVDQAA